MEVIIQGARGEVALHPGSAEDFQRCGLMRLSASYVGLPWGPVVTTALKMRRVQVRSLVQKLRPRVLPSEAKNNNNDDAFHVRCSNPETQLLCPVLWLFGRSVLSDSSVAPWTVACRAPLSIGFPGKDTGVGCVSFSRGSS